MKYLTTYFRTPTFRKKYGHISFIITSRGDSEYEFISKPIKHRAEYCYTSSSIGVKESDLVRSKSNEIFLFNSIKIENKIKKN